MRLLAVALLIFCGATFARADARQDEAARNAYKVGRAAYETGDYQLAYDKFKESFQLSHEPALLYNIASALQGLKRPHEAAEALRSFLRLQPNDPDKPKIEQRIATLEEEQRMIDIERQKAEAEAEAERRAERAADRPDAAAARRAHRRRARVGDDRGRAQASPQGAGDFADHRRRRARRRRGGAGAGADADVDGAVHHDRARSTPGDTMMRTTRALTLSSLAAATHRAPAAAPSTRPR